MIELPCTHWFDADCIRCVCPRACPLTPADHGLERARRVQAVGGGSTLTSRNPRIPQRRTRREIGKPAGSRPRTSTDRPGPEQLPWGRSLPLRFGNAVRRPPIADGVDPRFRGPAALFIASQCTHHMYPARLALRRRRPPRRARRQIRGTSDIRVNRVHRGTGAKRVRCAPYLPPLHHARAPRVLSSILNASALRNSARRPV